MAILSTSSYQKININQARKIYNDGGKIYLLPNRIRIGNAWIDPFDVKKTESGKSFDKLCDEFRYYNCNASQGRSIAFYIDRKYIQMDEKKAIRLANKLYKKRKK